MSAAAGIKAGRAYIELGLKENVAREITRVGAKLQSLGRSATLVGSTALGAAAGMGALLLKPLQLAGNLEQTQTKFTTMLGSADAAVRMLDLLKQKAAATPFELTDLQNATEALLNFGVDARKIPEALDALGNASGGNAERFKSLALVFGQVSANGRLTGQDLLQMVNAGFNPLQEIAKRTGETMGQLRDRMEAGAIGVDELELAFQSATGPGGRFFGLMEAQSKTLLGRFSTLKDEIAATLLPIGTALSPIAMRVIDAVASMLPPLSRFFEENQRIIQVIGIAVVAIATVGAVFVVAGGAAMAAGFAMSSVTAIMPALVTTAVSLRTAFSLMLRPLGMISVGMLLLKAIMLALSSVLATGVIQRASNEILRLSSIVRQQLSIASKVLKQFGADVYERISAPISRIVRAVLFLLRERRFGAAARLLGTAIAKGIVDAIKSLIDFVPAVMAKVNDAITRGIDRIADFSPRLAALARVALGIVTPLLSVVGTMKAIGVASVGLGFVLRTAAAMLLTPWGLVIAAIGGVAVLVYKFGEQIGVSFDRALKSVNETIGAAMAIARDTVNRYAGEILRLIRSGDYAAAAAMAWKSIASAARDAMQLLVAHVQRGLAFVQQAANATAAPFGPLFTTLKNFGAAIVADIYLIISFAKKAGAFMARLGGAVNDVLKRFPWIGTALGHATVIAGVALGVIFALAAAINVLTVPIVFVAAVVVKAAIALRTIWMAMRAVSSAAAIVGRSLWSAGGAARGFGSRFSAFIRGLPGMLLNLKSRLVAALPALRNFGGGLLRLLAGGNWKAAATLAGTAILLGLTFGWKKVVQVVPVFLAQLKAQILSVAPWMEPVINAIVNVARVIGGAYLLIGTFLVGAAGWVLRFGMQAWDAIKGLPEYMTIIASATWMLVQEGFKRAINILQALFALLPNSANQSMGAVGGLIGTAVDWISATFAKLSTYVGTVFGSMTNALMAGNFGLAAEIAMTEVQMVFLRAMNWLKQAWALTVFGMGTVFSTLSDTVRDIFQTIVDWIATAILKAMGLIQSLLQKASNLPGIGTKAAEAAASIGDMQGAVTELQRSNQARDSQIAKDRAAREQGRLANLTQSLSNNRTDLSAVEQRRMELQAKAARGMQALNGPNPLANSLGNLSDDLRKSLNQQLLDVEAAQAAADAEAANKKAGAGELAKRSRLAGAQATDLSKTQSTGSFSAAAANLLGGGNVQDKIAKATERAAKAGEATAAGVQRLNNKPEPALG